MDDHWTTADTIVVSIIVLAIVIVGIRQSGRKKQEDFPDRDN